MHRISALAISLVFLASLFASGCSLMGAENLRAELSDRGPILLSRDNPYIAANLLLSNEAKKSTVVQGFLDLRGAPDALEVRERFLKPTKIYLFYLGSAQAYAFEELDKDWLVLGPEAIPETLKGKFSELPLVEGAARPPLLTGAVGYGPEGAKPNLAEPEVVKPPVPTPAKAEPKKAQAKKKTEEKTETPSAELAAFPPEADALVATESAPSQSGDVFHIVQYPGETLRIIASWYTGDPENASRIARINSISNPNVLNLSQKVRVPNYLVKNHQPLPAAEVENYKQNILNDAQQAGSGS